MKVNMTLLVIFSTAADTIHNSHGSGKETLGSPQL